MKSCTLNKKKLREDMKTKLNNKTRVTALVGAGAALQICPQDKNYPSTANITKRVMEEYPDIITSLDFNSNDNTTTSKLVLRLYKHLCRTQFPSPVEFFTDESYSSFNFEVLFHILELLHSYDESWNCNEDEYTSSGQYEHFRHDLFSPFAHFIKPTFNHNPLELSQILGKYIRRITDIVNEYDSYFSTNKNKKICKWYKDFWAKPSFKWDVFNLNYDTTIEQSIARYNDGFKKVAKDDKFQVMDLNKLLENKEGNTTINHLHGCIIYGDAHISSSNPQTKLYNSNDLYKFDNYTDTPKYTSSYNNAQNRQSYYPSPIITGLDKVEKITTLPFAAYRMNLEKQIINNHSLLIVGYSFGDLYINDMIDRMRLIHGDKQRIVIIDYWGEVLTNYENGVMPYIENLQSRKPKISENEIEQEKIGYLKDMIQNFAEFNNKVQIYEAGLISRAMQRSIWDIRQECTLKDVHAPLVSKNKQLMLFIRGFKEAVTNHQQEIYSFLLS